MKTGRTWLIGLVVGILAIPSFAVHAQSSSPNAVVLLASSNLPENERSIMSGLLERLSNDLGPDDRLGVILFSDIVEHVSPLAPPSADESLRIERAFNALSAVNELNGAVGVDRALELLSESTLNRTIIIVGELDIRLENQVLMGRYTRWLEGTLLPTAAAERIGLMIIAGQDSHQGLQQRYGTDTFAHLAATEFDAQTLTTLALQHVQTRAAAPPIVAAPTLETPPAESTTTTAATSTTTQPAAPLPEAVADPVVVAEADTFANSVAEAAALAEADVIVDTAQETATEPVVTAAADTVQDVVTSQAPVAAPNTQAIATDAPQSSGSSSNLIDRLSMLSIALLVAIAALILGLVGAAVFYLFGRRQQRPSKASRQHSAQTHPTEMRDAPTVVRTFAETMPATALAVDATVQTTRSNRDDGESRFDALIDSISGGEQETLPGQIRATHEVDDATIDTRTVDTGRGRSSNTADLTRELEDLTRERSTQYDFE